MNIPGLQRRRERRHAELVTVAEAAAEKALSPAVAMAAQSGSGATYGMPQVNPSSPFNQVGPGAGFEPLPRPAGIFDSGFGPGSPLFPDAIDPLGPNGRTIPRRSQYLISANINLIDRRVPWSVLKGLAEDVDIIQRCIQLTQDALTGLDWSWGFSPAIIQQIMSEQGITNSSKASSIAKDKYGDELDRMNQFWEYPDKRMGYSFSQWLTDVIYSHLVYDGIAVYPQYNLGGEIMSLSTIDTPTIKILLDNQGFRPQPPSPAYQQILYGFPRGEFQAENVEVDGAVPGGYTDDQLAYYVRRTHPDSVYGYSQVEECINLATLYMERQNWLHAEYQHGVTPKMLIETQGTETWTPEQLAYYEQIMNDRLSGQTQRRQNMFMLRPGMTAKQLVSDADAYKSVFDEYLIMQIGAKFGIPQAMLGIQSHSALSSGSKDKGQAQQSEQFATNAMRNFLIDCINDMSRRFMGVGPELTMTCTGGGDDEDDLTRAEADASDISSGIRTRNEVRAERGIPLMDEPEADQLGVTIATGVSFLAGALEAQHTAASIAAMPPPAPVHIHQAAPGAADATDEGSTGDADTGHVAGDGATGSDQGSGASTSGSGSASGSASTQSGGDSKSTGSGAVAAKDDTRQPDTDAEKAERTAFAKFVKARSKAGTWRDFEFQHVGADEASELNEQGRRESLPSFNEIDPTVAAVVKDALRPEFDRLHKAYGILEETRASVN